MISKRVFAKYKIENKRNLINLFIKKGIKDNIYRATITIYVKKQKQKKLAGLPQNKKIIFVLFCGIMIFLKYDFKKNVDHISISRMCSIGNNL